LARRANYIKRQRSSNSNVLLLDAGNALMGPMPIAIKSKGAVAVKAMNMMGYDALTVGDKDLTLGIKTLKQREDEANFPFLSANLVFSDARELLFSPYTMVKVGARNVGILGLTGSEQPMPLRLFDDTVVDLLDPVETARRYVAEMSAQADIIVVLSHLGLDKDEQLAKEVPGIDIIVGGLSRRLLQKPESVGKTIIVQAGYRGEWIGRLKVLVDSDGVVAYSEGNIVLLDDTHKDDPDMLAFVAKAKKEFSSQ